MSKTRQGIFLFFTACMAFLFSACGGNSGSSSNAPVETTPAAFSGIALPDEISAISDTETATPASARVAFRTLASAAADLPSTSDYATYITGKYVDEPALDVFGIIETILKALKQTHYADESVVNQGPYRAMVTWEEDGNSGNQGSKSIQEWIVDSAMVAENNADVNEVHLWIADQYGTVKVIAKIFEAPVQDVDGKYLTYGKWEINADFGDGAFYADADVNEANQVVLRISESRTENFNSNNLAVNTRAIMIKSASEGYGVVKVPNYDACWGGACDGLTEVPSHEGGYAYNTDYLALDPQGSGAIYKDRTSKVEFVYNYGVFDATTGRDVKKDYSFGFPIKFTNQEGHEQYGYYGAWQGRHNLWTGEGNALPDGTVVIQADVPNGQTPESYEVVNIPGTFLKELIAPAAVDQITGQPFETWVSRGFELVYDDLGEGLKWYRCAEKQWNNQTMQEDCISHAPVSLGLLEADSTGRKQVMISRWFMDGMMNMHQTNYDFDGSNLVENSMSENPGMNYSPVQGDMMFAWVGGQVYIEFNGTSWTQKRLISFDEQNWKPGLSTNPADDVPFSLALNETYNLNGQGVSYMVKQTAEGLEVKSLSWQAASPANTANLGLEQVSYFKNPWQDDAETYVLDLDTASADYLTLRYRTVNQGGPSIGSIVDNGQYGLQAYNASDEVIVDGNGEPLRFNWDAANDRNPWAAQTYITDTERGYIILDEPIVFEPIQLTAYNGSTYGFNLSFDGWMHGLPDVHKELSDKDYDIKNPVLGKLAAIPEGTELVEIGTTNSYLVKPLEVGVVLAAVTAQDISDAGGTVPDLTPTAGLDVNSIPVPLGNNLGTFPTGTDLLFVEGNPVQ